MPVRIKDLGVDLQVKTRGVEFEVSDAAGQMGDFYVTGTGVIWCRGKTQKANGKKVPWKKLIALLESL